MVRKCLEIGRGIANSQSDSGYPEVANLRSGQKMLRIQEMPEIREIREFAALFRIPSDAIFAWAGSKNGRQLGENGQFPVVF